MAEDKHRPGPFPVDDVTLDAIEHSLGYTLTFEDEDGNRTDELHGIGADYSLATLLDFLAGCTGRDPNEILVREARDESDLPEWERGRNWANAEVVIDTRIHYSEHDVIRALIDEVRRLRKDGHDEPADGHHHDPTRAV